MQAIILAEVEPEGILALFIPIVAIVGGISAGMFSMFLGYRRRKEIFALYHQQRMLALEKGVELPPLPDGLLNEEPRLHNPRRHLLKGLVWLFTGIALGLAVSANFNGTWPLFSLVPIGIGIAHLIYYAIEGKKESKAVEPRVPPPIARV